MERILGKRWTTVSIFLMIAAAVILGVRFITVGSIGPAQKPLGINASDWDGSGLTIRPGARVMIYLDRETPVGKARIVYKGLKKGRLTLDVRIPELDPVYTYRHGIAIEDARAGIRLAGMDWSLKNIRRGYLLLEIHSI